MTKRMDIKKIMVIGSGPIVIGQAAEFDYAGSQACLALKEEGYEVVLVNSNPATIMTDKETADTVYIEPITLEFVSKILYKEKPDAILPTLGGQTGLNMAVELDKSGILAELDIELIGTNLQAIDKAEDRELFRELMNELNEPVAESDIVQTVDDGVKFAKQIGYPVIIRPAFTLGGAGGGICRNEKELKKILRNGLALSPVDQCLVEKSIAGYKEIEYEVIRDSNDDVLVICSMENFDPVGIHTGDSIVFAPNQSLNKAENELLEKVSTKIIRALAIEGGCNVQLALHPNGKDYYVIEVNPRVSRSSALASKATGFPIALISAKIAAGLNFNEMYNPKTEKSFDQYDAHDIDYTVCKIPRWSADKFRDSDRTLTTQMKATGEVMSLGESLEESLLKAVRSLEINTNYLWLDEAREADVEEVIGELEHVKDDRLFYLAEAMRRGFSVEELYEKTKITPLFLKAIEKIIQIEQELKENKGNVQLLEQAKVTGFDDETIAKIWEKEEREIADLREANQMSPSFLPVDIWTNEDNEPYYYSSYTGENQSEKTDNKAVLVLGSGPIRIAQGVEFDYATVHSVKAIQELGYDAIVVNSNPETVSTDFSISDKLYFEPITLENVLEIIAVEKPLGVIVQFGGQTAINLADSLEEHGVNILGTTVEDVIRAENRDSFEKAIKEINIPQPQAATALGIEAALAIPEQIGGYPVMVRPSFVLGGRGMEVVENEAGLKKYVKDALKESKDNPILIDHYVSGIEVEVDAISDGEEVLIPGIMEHIEKSGVHSGDSMAVYPPQRLSQAVQDTIVDYTEKLCLALNTVGMMNIQFIVEGEKVYVIEVNPRASRTVPFLSKITDIPMSQVATKAILGLTLDEQGFGTGLYPYNKEEFYVKAPVFSFGKLNGVDPILGPEMKSTGEVMGTGQTYEEALMKSFEAADINAENSGDILFNVNEKDYKRSVSIAEELQSLGYTIVTDQAFADHLVDQNISATVLTSEEGFVAFIENNAVQLAVNTEGRTKGKAGLGKDVRLSAIAYQIPLFTSLDTLDAYIQALKASTSSIYTL